MAIILLKGNLGTLGDVILLLFVSLLKGIYSKIMSLLGVILYPFKVGLFPEMFGERKVTNE